MAREVRVGDTVGYRDTNGDWQDAVVTVVTTQDSLTIRVPHADDTGWTERAAVARMTAPTQTNVFRKVA